MLLPVTHLRVPVTVRLTFNALTEKQKVGRKTEKQTVKQAKQATYQRTFTFVEPHTEGWLRQNSSLPVSGNPVALSLLLIFKTALKTHLWICTFQISFCPACCSSSTSDNLANSFRLSEWVSEWVRVWTYCSLSPPTIPPGVYIYIRHWSQTNGVCKMSVWFFSGEDKHVITFLSVRSLSVYFW